MGRPIYVHVEEDALLTTDQECRGWRSFALRLGRTTQSLRDFEASTDASNDPAGGRYAGPLTPLTDINDFPDTALQGLEGEYDEGDWDGSTLVVRGHTRTYDAPRTASPELPHIHPVTWTPLDHGSEQVPAASASTEDWQDMERAGSQGMPWRGVRLPEWSTPSPRSRRLPRRPTASESRRRWMAAANHSAAAAHPLPESAVSMRARDVMRRELMGTTVGRRAAGDIMPSVREAWDQGRTTSALEMARHAARDLLHQLDVRIAESRARNQIAREELDANLNRAAAAHARAVQHADLDACDLPEL